MSAESQQQIAREAAEHLYVTHGIKAECRNQVAAVILYAIERATEAHDRNLISIAAKRTAEEMGRKRREAEESVAQPQPSKARKEQAPSAEGSPASGEQPMQCTCEDYDPRGAIRDPDCPMHDEHGEERPQRPRGQQQEWTVEYVTGLYKQMDGLQKITDAHNAALAAGRMLLQSERDSTARLSGELAASQNQLVTERKAKEKEADRYCNAVKDHAETRMGLIADRQRREQAEGKLKAQEHRITDEVESLNQQLLSALAEIKAASDAHGCACTLETIDLSALHEHDAKVREPLVEALQMFLDNGLTAEAITVAQDAMKENK